MPVEDIEMLERIENMIDIEEADKRKNEPVISLDELRKELDL